MLEKITTGRAAEILGVSPGRIRQLILAGLLRAEKVGRDHLLDPAEVKFYDESRRPAGRPRKEDEA
jgi:excisionase family DNA binding protein